MPLPRGLELMTDEERAVLLPGERPLALELASQISGYSGIGRDEKPSMGLGFDPVPGPGSGVQVDQGWMDAKVGGVNAAGAAGSLADRFSRALNISANAKLLVSNRRVAVIANDGSLKGPQQVHFEVERGGVVRAERTPRLLQRGRIKLTFADGSWATAMLGIVKTGAAERVLEALGSR